MPPECAKCDECGSNLLLVQDFKDDRIVFVQYCPGCNQKLVREDILKTTIGQETNIKYGGDPGDKKHG